MSSLRDGQTQPDTRDTSGKTNENCSWSSCRIAEELFLSNSQFVYINYPLFQGLSMHNNSSPDGRVGSVIPTCLIVDFLWGGKKATFQHIKKESGRILCSIQHCGAFTSARNVHSSQVLKNRSALFHPRRTFCDWKPQHALSTSSLVFPGQLPMLWPFLPFPNGLRPLCFTSGPDLSGEGEDFLTVVTVPLTGKLSCYTPTRFIRL